MAETYTEEELMKFFKAHWLVILLTVALIASNAYWYAEQQKKDK